MTPQIIPAELKKKIRKAAQLEAVSLWDIADLANEVMEHVKKERVADRLEGVYDFQVWAAIGTLCAKSTGRIKKLALIARTFTPQVREPFVERWGFGYFERAFDVGPPIPHPQTGEIIDERIQAIEFLDDYAKGDLSVGGGKHEPTVSEFMLIYQQHILGIATQEGGGRKSTCI